MSEALKILKLFPSEKVSPKFQALCELYFSDTTPMCEGFELASDFTETLQYLLPPEKLELHKDSFILFAQATHSGSLYAFFIPDDKSVQEEWPVVVFGDEGGVLVLAKNLDDFMRFIGLNVQPYIETNYDTNQYEFYLSDNESFPLPEYTEWLENQFKIKVPQTIQMAIDEIIKPAQDLYQKRIDAIIGGSE